MSKVVEVESLVKRYGSLAAVDDVTFSVEEGEVFGVLGPNGAGKTTTVEMIEGLRKPDGGSIRVFGIDTLREPERIKELIGVQLQTTSLYDRIRVKEAVDLFGGYYRRAIPTATLLDEVSLTDKMNSYVSELSGGQRQRLALALALVNDPGMVFLDEPTTGLDPQARRGVWGTIAGLRQKGKTIILTTHYMEEAEKLCRRVAIMDHGKIITLDTPDALIAGAGLDSRIEIDHVPEALRSVLERAGLSARVSEDGDKMILHTKNSSQVLKEITRVAAEQDIDLGSISVQKATLEDVFLTLTGRQLRE
ncbi:MAG: ABC transporter ATP-binding protein [Dehalococcoidia bacterium]|nr:MAG: ABC transporter ATP-binding protein [Dehalococcoidia bacterium]